MMTDREQIVATARQLLETNGPEAVTMRAIATKLGIKAPSLYKHIRDKAELEAALITEGFTEQAEAFEKVVNNSPHPAQQFGATYRSWALRHPHLYQLMTGGPLPRDLLPAGLEDRAAAPLVAAARGDHDRARAAWAFAHGMVSLELADRFPPGSDLGPAWQLGLGQILPDTEHPGES
jgi:AcrR family transcriptional regulator